MAVAIKAMFTKADIRIAIQAQYNKIKDELVSKWVMVGERFINNARRKKTYKDRTGNLRSSIGYVVMLDGNEVASGGFSGTGADGPATGRLVVDEQKIHYRSGLALICVAGMNYAAAVESKGRDVITGSSQIAVQELKRAVKETK